LGYKSSWNKGYLFGSVYHKSANGTITRIASVVPGSTLIYSIMQNAGKSYNSGLELLLAQDIKNWFSFNINFNGYQSIIEAFRVENKYPAINTYSSARQELISWNSKFNGVFHLKNKTDIQLTAIYLAPDLIPQGKIGTRFSIDIGIKKQIQKGKGELFLNATDLFNTMQVHKEIQGTGFYYISTDYYETQVIRVGYNYKF
jgi:outer membrane receptor protein involved in Fe transport